jgi:putative phage-type endonuclease
MIEQGTQAWRDARYGKITASRCADLMAKTKSGYSKSRDNYIAQLVCERMTNTPTEGFTSEAMRWGTEKEPLAKEAFEAEHLLTVDDAPFIVHPEYEFAGASPDGFVGKDLIEVKCPNTATHIETLRKKKPDGKYVKQMQFQMWVTGARMCYFVSFDPRMPEGLQLWVTEVDRDDDMIAEIEAEVLKANVEIEAIIEELINTKTRNTQ